MRKYNYLFITVIILFAHQLVAQEETPFVAYDVPSQNLVKFNRFLLNPTFSTVREDKSYINLFHRNQSVSFNDNNQTYFLSYSGRIGDRSGVGLSLYTQREGLIDNFGLLANYAYGVKLSEKSNLTFGGNFSYYNSGFNQNRANPVDDDPLLNGLDNSALITFQPGFNISYGAFDFGVLADNLFDYNLKTNESLTEFGEKTYTGHLQYTHQFKNSAGILENARLMPLARVRTDPLNDITLGGSLILDVPKLGWLQAGYDDFYGAAAGVGFNLNKRISLGYTVEKGLSNTFENFGVTHEISLAYSFTPNLTEDRVMLEKDNDLLVSNEEDEVPLEELSLTEKDLKINELEKKLAENNSIIDELLYRQDSIEKTRQGDLERRFATVMRMVKRETNGENPELEEKAKQMYFANLDSIDIINSPRKSPLANTGLTNTTASKKVIKLKDLNNSVNSTKEPTVANSGLTNSNTSKKISSLKDMNTPAKVSPKETYAENTKKDKISTGSKKSYGFKSFEIPSVESGHYLIANVYKGTKYMQKFIDKLSAEGIEADYFTNPKNGLNYVYLKDFKNKNEAITAYKTGLNGAYSGDTWVMKVKGAYTDTAYASNTTSASNYDDGVLQKNVQNQPVQNNNGGVNYKTYDIDGLGSGFYIIANVFERPENANRFVRQLNAKGLNASYFINPENNYRYVYLKKHQDWTNALVSYYSKLNDAYEDQIWIMRVKPNQTA
ncbi:PorP/SprF family type IX secretion system membrane protein [Croceitalea rosinachiae]|uniref:PorP/SprF family type IX secretion system membrane protein n=1 Tax=Croceitalea rosinachiae TaxID=3075596 RepID=A0ABU3A7X2_9FLAO|nr:PorP/SprF family type IX secretion system membrane protein [Croceitalea sp. F388]MDT0606278.1 PorP/SprF family type IX secretion system membrane protein [Croceitalea sp. F388]